MRLLGVVSDGRCEVSDRPSLIALPGGVTTGLPADEEAAREVHRRLAAELDEVFGPSPFQVEVDRLSRDWEDAYRGHGLSLDAWLAMAMGRLGVAAEHTRMFAQAGRADERQRRAAMRAAMEASAVLRVLWHRLSEHGLDMPTNNGRSGA